MRKPTLAIVLAMGMAVASTPALAGDLWVVENNTGWTLYTFCYGLQYHVAPSRERDIDCREGTVLRISPAHASSSSSHSHNCQWDPVQRVKVTESSAPSSTTTAGGTDTVISLVDGDAGLAYDYSCESS